MTSTLLEPNLNDEPNCRCKSALIQLLIAIVVAGLYAIASWQNQFVYDDHEVIEDQFPVQHLSDIVQIFREPHYLNFPYYRPITRTTFAIQKSMIWGNSPRSYHLFNAGLAGCVFLASCLLLQMPVFQLGRAGALIASLWFCLHPAMSECVYPAASGRETLLPTLMILLTVWAYLHSGKIWFCVSMGLFVLSLLCKEQAAVLPGVFLLADVLGISHLAKRSFKYLLRRFIPVLTIFIAYFIVRHRIFGSNNLKLTVLEHPLEPLKSLLYSIQTAVLPFMELHYEPGFNSWFDARLAAVSSLVIGMLLLLGWTMAKAPRLVAFWIGWIILLQLPTAQILQQDAAYSERYVALALLGFPAMAGVVLLDLFSKRESRLIAGSVAMIWAILLGTISYLRGSYYQDETSFSLQWQNTSPRAAGPYNGFGLIAQQQHDEKTAIQSYEKALTIDPANATAHNNLANLLADENEFDGASMHYEWLLHHNPTGADSAATLSNYAQLLGMEAYRRHDALMRDRAHELLEKSIQLRPGYAQAHYVLGLWNEAFGTRRDALREYQLALQLRPDFQDAKGRLLNLTAHETTQPTGSK